MVTNEDISKLMKWEASKFKIARLLTLWKSLISSVLAIIGILEFRGFENNILL